MSLKRIGKGFGLNRSKQKFNTFKLTAPKVIANLALNHFLEGFRIGGKRTDASKKGWDARKRNVDPGRGILIGPKGAGRREKKVLGNLRDDVQILKANIKRIILGTKTIPYAIRHNEGTTDRLGRKMPKREFLGDSKELDRKIINELEKQLGKVML